jgi:hypothetical protein
MEHENIGYVGHSLFCMYMYIHMQNTLFYSHLFREYTEVTAAPRGRGKHCLYLMSMTISLPFFPLLFGLVTVTKLPFFLVLETNAMLIRNCS